MEPALATTSVDRRSVVALFSRLRSARGQANPLPFYTQLRAMGEMVPAPWGGHVATSYRLCHQVLRSRDWRVPDSGWRAAQVDAARWHAPASRQMGATMPMLNPPHHTRMRRPLGNVFDRTSLQRMQKSVKKNADRLLDNFFEELHGGTADFCAMVGDELPIITVGEWLGLPSADFPLLRTLTHDQVHTQELFPSPSQLAISDSATRSLREYFTGLIRERRKSAGDDPVSSWIRMWDEFEADQDAADEAVYALALFMVLAALETTSHLLTSLAWLLLEHPRQLDWLRINPEHIPGAIDETLRYDAPIHMISRIAPEDTELAGVPVRQGEMVQLMVGAAHHDPEQYAAPEVFDIRRKAPHLSFGGGIHYCLGNALARMEADCVLSSLLRRLPGQGLRVAGTPTWAPRVAFRRLMELPVVRA